MPENILKRAWRKKASGEALTPAEKQALSTYQSDYQRGHLVKVFVDDPKELQRIKEMAKADKSARGVSGWMLQRVRQAMQNQVYPPDYVNDLEEEAKKWRERYDNEAAKFNEVFQENRTLRQKVDYYMAMASDTLGARADEPFDEADRRNLEKLRKEDQDLRKELKDDEKNYDWQATDAENKEMAKDYAEQTAAELKAGDITEDEYVQYLNYKPEQIDIRLLSEGMRKTLKERWAKKPPSKPKKTKGRAK